MVASSAHAMQRRFIQTLQEHHMHLNPWQGKSKERERERRAAARRKAAARAEERRGQQRS